jgi:hypothetical protein
MSFFSPGGSEIMTLTEILNTSAEAANLQPQDQAALELARIYAAQIETAVNRRESKTIGDLGAKLLSTLTALGMTQAGRAARETIKGGAANDNPDPAAATFAALRASFN